MALDLNDKTSNGNTLTNVSAAEVTSNLAFAATTSAADLEASSSAYLWAADSPSLSITGPLTLEKLINVESDPADGQQMVLIDKSDNGASVYSYHFDIRVNGGTKELNFFYSTDGTYQAANDVAVAWTWSTGTWYHVAVVLDTAGPTVKFYVDGAQQGATQNPTGTSIFNNDKRLGIGAYSASGTPGSFYDGVVDEVRVWSVARTEAEINNNKANELTGGESGLAAYWPFEAAIAIPGPGGVMTTNRGFWGA